MKISRRDFLNGVAIGARPEVVALHDPDWKPGEAPHEIGRRPFGRIVIANSDSGATAYTDVAIDQGSRAVDEVLNCKDVA